MKLQLNPQQLLSLYELVVSSLSEPTDFSSRSSLNEVRQKIQELILESLDKTNDSKKEKIFPAWLKREQDKISSLNDDLKKVKIIPKDSAPPPVQPDNSFSSNTLQNVVLKEI